MASASTPYDSAESVPASNPDSSECSDFVEVSTLEFLQATLPADGYKFVALAKAGGQGLAHKAYESLEVMAQAIDSYDRQENLTVYHACASYKAPSYDTVDLEGKRKRKFRGQPNWDKAKSLWCDVDCGEDKAAEGKGYATKGEAAKLIHEFCTEKALPQPLIVDSGGGIHCYWPFTKTVGPNTWIKMGTMLKTAFKEAGLLVDPTRTADLSSVLRPVGTHNRKPGREVREVKAKTTVTFTEPETLFKVLSKITQPVELPLINKYAAHVGLNDELTAHLGPKLESSANGVANHCAQVAAVRDTQGDVSYEHWRGVVGILKHCVEGYELAVEWSARRGITGHTNTDVRTRYESWDAGPAKCEFFQGCNPDGCTSCLHKGKITSPIQLGRLKSENTNAATLADRLVTWDPKAPKPAKREFLINDGGLFPLKAVSTLAGLGGSMKSAQAIMLGIYGALGKAWNGWHVPEGQTLILSGEDDATEFQRRMGGYANACFPSDDFSKLQLRVHCLPLAGLGVRLTEIRTGTPQMTSFVASVIEVINGLNAGGQPPVRLVVMDHARLLIGGDLNDSESATAGMEAGTRIALETGAAVVLIAHSPKSAASAGRKPDGFGVNDVLGSGAFVDNSRFAVAMTSLVEDERNKFGLTADQAKELLVFRVIKSNYSESGRVVYLKKTPVPGWGVAYPDPIQLATPQKAAPSNLVDRVVASVVANPGGYTRGKFRTESGKGGHLKASDKKLRVAIDAAVASGRLIERQATPKDVSAYGVRLRDVVLDVGVPHVE